MLQIGSLPSDTKGYSQISSESVRTNKIQLLLPRHLNQINNNQPTTGNLEPSPMRNLRDYRAIFLPPITRD